ITKDSKEILIDKPAQPDPIRAVECGYAARTPYYRSIPGVYILYSSLSSATRRDSSLRRAPALDHPGPGRKSASWACTLSRALFCAAMASACSFGRALPGAAGCAVSARTTAGRVSTFASFIDLHFCKETDAAETPFRLRTRWFVPVRKRHPRCIAHRGPSALRDSGA